MLKKGSDEAVWFEYVTKLHDRDIEKRRNSGFTTWAVLSLASILLYRVLDRVELLQSPGFGDLMAITLTAIVNLAYAFAILLLSFVVGMGSGEEVRLMPKLSRTSRPVFYVPLFVVGCVITILNFYAVAARLSYQPLRWPYYVFGVYYGLNICIPLFKKFRALIKAKRDYPDIPVLSSPAILSYSLGNIIVRLFLLAMGSFLLFCAIAAISYLFRTLPMGNVLAATKTSLELIAFTALVFFLLGHLANQMRTQFLGNLERRILTEDLKAEEISSIFAKQYLGETLRDWVTQVEAKLKTLSNATLDTIRESENEMRDLSEIDTKYVYEIEGRRKSICKKAHDSAKEYLTFTEKLLNHTEHLVGEQAFLSQAEALTRVTSSWKEQNKAVKINLNTLCETCRAVLDLTKEDKTACDKDKAEQGK